MSLGFTQMLSPPFTLTGRTQSILAVLAEWEGRHHNEKVVKNGRSHYASTETTLSKIQEWMTIFNYNNRPWGNVDTAPMTLLGCLTFCPDLHRLDCGLWTVYRMNTYSREYDTSNPRQQKCQPHGLIRIKSIHTGA